VAFERGIWSGLDVKVTFVDVSSQMQLMLKGHSKCNMSKECACVMKAVNRILGCTIKDVVSCLRQVIRLLCRAVVRPHQE